VTTRTKSRPHRQRTPVLVAMATVLGVVLGRLVNAGSALRRVTLQFAGLGMICWGAWTANTVAGMIATGVSLLVLEALTTRSGSGE
jgi:hypothetical protein